jgi:hypothetical protein
MIFSARWSSSEALPADPRDDHRMNQVCQLAAFMLG